MQRGCKEENSPAPLHYTHIQLEVYLIVFVATQGVRNGTETGNRDRKQEREQNNVLNFAWVERQDDQGLRNFVYKKCQGYLK